LKNLIISKDGKVAHIEHLNHEETECGLKINNHEVVDIDGVMSDNLVVCRNCLKEMLC